MKKPLIAIDVDDVLAVEREGIRAFINNTYGLDLTIDDYSVPGPYWGYWEHVWRVDEATGKEWYAAYLDSEAQAYHAVSEGAIDTLTALSDRYRFAVVTSRKDQTLDVTHRWLEQHFPNVFEQVEFVTLWDKDRKVTKAQICEHLGADFLIDDNIEHCTIAAEAGLRPLLFGEYGWNGATDLHSGIQRVFNWQQVLEYFNAK